MTSSSRVARWRSWLVVLVAGLAAMGLAAAPAQAAAGGSASTAPGAGAASSGGITVLSYNIHHGAGTDGRLDLARIAAVIRGSGADVVALQEVDRFWARSGGVDQAAELGRMLRMRHVFGANLDLAPETPGEPRRQYGTAVLSRFPITASVNTPLPNLGGEQRGLLHARLVVPGTGALSVYSTHLQHNNSAERAAQADAVVAHIGAPREPVVLAGDLNALPGAADIAALRDSYTDRGTAPTFPAGAADRRIDYVLTGDRVSTLAADVLATGAAAVASDHLPVRAVLEASRPYTDTRVLPDGHAHNDYEHRRPLFDALHHGFTSVEADVWLVGGELRVAHDLIDTVPGRTLSSLYLDPLADITRDGRGRIYPGRTAPIQLLVDLKSEAETTYAALDRVLARYRPLVGSSGTVQVVVSGNRPRATMAADRTLLAGYDGRLTDLAAPEDAEFLPLISDNWTRHFTWRGEGAMPAAERATLRRIVDTAHADGRRVRFWATPDQPGPARAALWAELRAAGVDHLNTDDLAGFAATAP